MDAKFKVEFDIPFVVHLTEEEITVQVEGDEFRVWLTMVDQPHQDPRLGFKMDNSELDSDRHGWVRYTHARVEYDRALAMEDDESAVSRALEAVNLVVEHYRDATDRDWVRPLAIADLPAPSIVWPSLNDRPQLTVNKIRIADWRPKVISIHPDLEAQIRLRVADGEHVPAHRQMLSDARDALQQGNDRLAVIIGQSAVENALDRALLAEFRRRGMRLEEIRQALAKKRRGKNWLSPEDAIRWTPIDSKIGPVLRGLGLPSIEDDATLWLEWDVANALRNSAVHAASAPSAAEAEDAVRAFGRIIREYFEPLQSKPGDPVVDIVEESIQAMRDVIDEEPDPKLVRVVNRILPLLGHRLVFHHKNFHPRRRERFFDVSAEPAGDELHIWIDSRVEPEEFGHSVAGVLVAYELKAEGFPRARPGPHFPHDLVSRQAWELVGKELEMSILHLAESRRLADFGFDVDSRARKSYEVFAATLSSDTYEPIDPNDLRAKTAPLQYMSKALLLQSDDRRRLLELAASKDPYLASTATKLIHAVKRTGYASQEQAVRAMVACHDLLLMLDTCVVVDGVARKIYGSQMRSFAVGERNTRPRGE